MEEMKMEMTVTAPIAGTLTGLAAKIAEHMAEGTVLRRLKATE
jgi:biotin carboxyl carrier protein